MAGVLGTRPVSHLCSCGSRCAAFEDRAAQQDLRSFKSVTETVKSDIRQHHGPALSSVPNALIRQDSDNNKGIYVLPKPDYYLKCTLT